MTLKLRYNFLSLCESILFFLGILFLFNLSVFINSQELIINSERNNSASTLPINNSDWDWSHSDVSDWDSSSIISDWDSSSIISDWDSSSIISDWTNEENNFKSHWNEQYEENWIWRDTTTSFLLEREWIAQTREYRVELELDKDETFELEIRYRKGSKTKYTGFFMLNNNILTLLFNNNDSVSYQYTLNKPVFSSDRLYLELKYLNGLLPALPQKLPKFYPQ